MFPYSKNLWEWKEKTKNSKILNWESSTTYCTHSFWRWKKKDGEEYEPTTLWSFVFSFDRYLRKRGYPTVIIEGQELRKTRETLVAKQRELKKAGKGNKTKAARALTDEKVDVLHSKELLGVSSSESLLNTLWLNNKSIEIWGNKSIEIWGGATFSHKPVRMEPLRSLVRF